MVISIVFYASVLIASVGSTPSIDINRALAICAEETDSLKRLTCYDQLANLYGQGNSTNYIQPNAEFLASKLVVEPWEPEYSLSIADFVALISTAVLEDGSKIEIEGWVKKNKRYVLTIRMYQPVQLTFLPGDRDKTKENLSLLEPVVLRGMLTDPSQFILTIASMTPDN